MQERSTIITASVGLILGSVLGIAGTFAPTTELRGLAWGIDGVGLVVASSLLAMYYFRRGSDLTASGFLIFAIGQGFILSSGAILEENHTSFAAGTSLWAASLLVISSQRTFPLIIRLTGLIAAILFAIVSVMIFKGDPVNALTKPFPFYAYPVFVITIFGWAFTLLKQRPGLPS